MNHKVRKQTENNRPQKISIKEADNQKPGESTLYLLCCASVGVKMNLNQTLGHGDPHYGTWYVSSCGVQDWVPLPPDFNTWGYEDRRYRSWLFDLHMVGSLFEEFEDPNIIAIWDPLFEFPKQQPSIPPPVGPAPPEDTPFGYAAGITRAQYQNLLILPQEKIKWVGEFSLEPGSVKFK